MNYKIVPLTKELLNELKAKDMAWSSYTLDYKSVAVYPPYSEKPLVVTEALWKNYFKSLWDKGIYTYSHEKAIASCVNPDRKWMAEYRSKAHLRKVYEEKLADYQKHSNYKCSSLIVRKTWTRNERAEFRHTSTWINFRNSMVKSHDYTCERCNKRFKDEDMEVHHLYEDTNYDNLDPSRFLVLCLSCHDKIHEYDQIRKVKPVKKIKAKPIKKIKMKKIKKVKEVSHE